MNSKSASAQRGGSTSFSNMEFDFGICSNRSRSLNDLKNQNNSSKSSSPYTFQSMNSRPPAAAPTPHPNTPSWTHQTATTSTPPVSMAGDIFGKTWAASSSSSSNIGIVNKNPNLFGDLVSSALGQGRGRCNIPLRNTVSVKTNSSRGSPIRSSNLSTSNLGHDFFGFPTNFEESKMDNQRDDIFGEKIESRLPERAENKPAAEIMGEKKSINFVDCDAFSKNCEQSGGGVVIPGLDEWESDSKYEGTTSIEINGGSPPPVGVSATNAFDRGMNHQKQGQYADAIKWLSWALDLPKKSYEEEIINEILSCRASCYKEVGEYKKAIADCTEALKKEGGNVGVLVKRALLYESVEKYRLGAEDLRKVMNLDPTNRLARSTIHRLTQLS